MVVVLVFLIVTLVPASLAEAYLDPGTGSYLTQWLVAILVGSMVAIRVYWGRLMAFFRKRPQPSDGSRPQDPSGPNI